MRTRLPMGSGFTGGLAASLGPAFRQMAGMRMNRDMAHAQGALVGAQTAAADEKARDLAMTNRARQNPLELFDDPSIAEYVQSNPAYANALRVGLRLFGATGQGDVAGMLSDLQRADLTGQGVQRGNAGNLSEQNRLIAAATGQTYDPFKAVGSTGLVIDGGTGNMRREANSEIYQTLIDAGLTPGTPDFQRAMLDSTRRGTTVNVGGQGEVGTIPPGFELLTDPTTGARSMRPIPGGPAAQEADKLARTQAEADDYQGRFVSAVVQDTNRAIDLIESGDWEIPPYGLTGVMASAIPGTSAHQLKRLIDSMEASVSIENLNAMRRASPTGGALGNVSEKQLAVLGRAFGELNQSQGREDLLDNFRRLHNIFLDIAHGIGNGPERYALSFDNQGRRVEGGAPWQPEWTPEEELQQAVISQNDGRGPSAAIQPGHVEDGWQYMGGDPGDARSWQFIGG